MGLNIILADTTSCMQLDSHDLIASLPQLLPALLIALLETSSRNRNFFIYLFLKKHSSNLIPRPDSGDHKMLGLAN